MLNPYTLNIQESLKHAWHWGIGFLRCLAAKVLKNHQILINQLHKRQKYRDMRDRHLLVIAV